jgi:hypothetical protein
MESVICTKNIQEAVGGLKILSLGRRSWISITRDGKRTQFAFETDTLTSEIIEDFAQNHNISLTTAIKTLTFIGDQTTKLAERGLDVADYSEEL